MRFNHEDSTRQRAKVSGIKHITRRGEISTFMVPWKIATKAGINRVLVVATINGELLGKPVIFLSPMNLGLVEH